MAIDPTDKVLQAVTQTVADAAGPRWYELRPTDRSQILEEIWTGWAKRIGEPAGLVRTSERKIRGRFVRGEGRTPDRIVTSVELQVADPEVVLRSLAPFAATALRQVNWPSLLLQASLEGVEPETPATEPGSDVLDRAMFGGPVTDATFRADDASAPDAGLTSDAPAFETFIELLAAKLSALDTSPAADQRALVLLVRLHLGQRVLLGAPEQLYPPQRYSRRRGVFYTPKRRATGQQREGAFDDFLRYHAAGRAKQTGACPTCRLLARFLRVPDLTQPALSRLMDNFVLTALD